MGRIEAARIDEVAAAALDPESPQNQSIKSDFPGLLPPTDPEWLLELGATCQSILIFDGDGKSTREDVFCEKPHKSDLGAPVPRVLVGADSVAALNAVHQTVVKSNKDLKEILSKCRAAYFKELQFLREKIYEAQGLEPPRRAPPIDTEVYFYDELQYLDEDTQEILKRAVGRAIEDMYARIEALEEELKMWKGEGLGTGAQLAYRILKMILGRADMNVTIKDLATALKMIASSPKDKYTVEFEFVGNLREDYERLEAANAELRMDLKETQTKLTAAEEELERQRTRVAQLEKQLEESKDQTRRAQEECMRLKAEIAAMKVELAQLEQIKHKLEETEKKLKAAEEREQKLKDEVQKMRVELQKMAMLKEELEKAKKELAELRPLKQKVADLEAQIEKLKKEIAEFDKVKARLEKEKAELKDALDAERIKVQQLKDELEAEKERYRKLEEMVAGSKKRIDELEKEVARLTEKNAALEEALAKERELREDLQRKLDRANLRIEQLEAENAALKAKVKELEARIKELEELVEQLQAEIDALRDELDALKAAMKKKKKNRDDDSGAGVQMTRHQEEEPEEKESAAVVVITGRHHEVETYQMMIRRLISEGVLKRHFMLFFDSMRRDEWRKFWTKAATCQTFRQFELMFEHLRGGNAKLVWDEANGAPPPAKPQNYAMPGTFGTDTPLTPFAARQEERLASERLQRSEMEQSWAMPSERSFQSSGGLTVSGAGVDSVLEFAPVYNQWGEPTVGDAKLYKRAVYADEPDDLAASQLNRQRLERENLELALASSLSEATLDSFKDPRASLGPMGVSVQGRKSRKKDSMSMTDSFRFERPTGAGTGRARGGRDHSPVSPEGPSGPGPELWRAPTPQRLEQPRPGGRPWMSETTSMGGGFGGRGGHARSAASLREPEDVHLPSVAPKNAVRGQIRPNR